MPLLSCPHCNAKMTVPDNFGNRQVKCPKCNSVFDSQPATPAPLATAMSAPIAPTATAEPVGNQPTKANPWAAVGGLLMGLGAIMALLAMVAIDTTTHTRIGGSTIEGHDIGKATMKICVVMIGVGLMIVGGIWTARKP